MINKGRILKVDITLIVHETATEDEVSEALEHHLACRGGVSLDNPLVHGDWDVASLDWDDTGRYALYAVDVVDVGKNSSARCQTRTLQTADRRTAEESDGWRSRDTMIRNAISEARVAADLA